MIRTTSRGEFVKVLSSINQDSKDSNDSRPVTSEPVYLDGEGERRPKERQRQISYVWPQFLLKQTMASLRIALPLKHDDQKSH